MHRKKLYILTGIIVLLLLQGCVSKEEAGEELMQYFNEDLNFSTSDHFSDVLRKRFDLEDEDLEEQVKAHLREDVLPATQNVIDHLESLEYKSRSVRNLNKKDIKIHKTMYDMFEDMVESLNEGSTVDEVNSEFSSQERELKRKMDAYFDKRDRLIKKYELKSYKDYEGDGTGETKLKRKNDS